MIDSELWLSKQGDIWARVVEEEFKELNAKVRRLTLQSDAYKDAWLRLAHVREQEKALIISTQMRLDDREIAMEGDIATLTLKLRQARAILRHIEENEHGIGERTATAIEQFLDQTEIMGGE